MLSGTRDASRTSESAQYAQQRVDESRICYFLESNVPPDPNVELLLPNKPPPKLAVPVPKAVFDGCPKPTVEETAGQSRNDKSSKGIK